MHSPRVYFNNIWTILYGQTVCVMENDYHDKPSVNTRSFLDTYTFSLHQHVTFPTHIYGNWLDLFITQSNCKHVKAVSSSDGVSDHLTVLIDLWLQIKSSPEKANIMFRPINKIDLDTLHMDLSNYDLLMHPKTSLLEQTALLSETLSHLHDKHAPKQTNMTQPRPPSRSMSLEIILDKRRRRNDHSRDFPEPPHVENTMDQFTHTTTSEVRSIILKSTNASCDLDPFPTRLLKHYIDDLIVPITAIINLSMREGVVPPDFKQALVTPLIKKKTLCRN